MDYELLMAYLFRAGVIVAAVLILIGTVALFVSGGSNGYSLSQIASPKSPVNSSVFQPYEVIDGVPKFRPLDLIYLGLMVLIAVPVARVVIALVQFASERNKLYVFIASIVLFNLMFAIFILPLLLGK